MVTLHPGVNNILQLDVTFTRKENMERLCLSNLQFPMLFFISEFLIICFDY